MGAWRAMKTNLGNILAANWFPGWIRPVQSLVLQSLLFNFTNISESCHQLTKFGKMPDETAIYLRYVKLTPYAFSPSKGSDKAAGFDLKSAYHCVIPPRSKEMVRTDLQIMLPEGCYGRVAPRSGLTWKNSIDVGAGVIDEDYRGEVRVILFNHSDEPFIIQAGDRIAQLICERICYPKLQEVEKLNDTSRGSNGFGSTGKN